MATKIYIDETFYSYNYKPNLSASIQDKYTNGIRNQANFESFATRASELMNRLADNTIENLGGIDSLTVTPQQYVKKATAAMVEYWYLNNFSLGNIDASFTAGAASADTISTKMIKIGNELKRFIPETVLILMQTSGMTKQTLIGVNTSNKSANKIPGLAVKDILTVNDAFTFFQQKGNYDNNFHKDLNIQDILTGSTNKRYVLIGKSEPGQNSMTIGLLGGNEKSVIGSKLFITLNRNTNDPTVISLAESVIVTLNPKAAISTEAPGEPNFIGNINIDNEMELWVELQSDIDIADILITDIVPDDNAMYGVQGTSLNKPNGEQITKLTVVQSSSNNKILQDQITQNFNDIAKNNNVINAKQTAIDANTHSITVNKGNIDKSILRIDNNENEITSIKSNAATIANNKLSKIDANDNFIHREKGAGYHTEMALGYTATNPLDVVTKTDLDLIEQNAENEIYDLRTDITALQNEITSSENVWTGNQILTGDADTGEADFSTTLGDDGLFDFTKGRTIYVSVYDTNTKLGGTVQCIVGKTNYEVKSLASGGGTSETVGVRVDETGKIFVNETTSGINVTSNIIIDRVAEPSKLSIVAGGGAYALKTQLAFKQDMVDTKLTTAGLATDNVIDGIIENKNNVDKTLGDLTTTKALATQLGNVNVSDNRDLSDLADTTDKTNVLATEKYVDENAFSKSDVSPVTIPAAYGWVAIANDALIDANHLGKKVKFETDGGIAVGLLSRLVTQADLINPPDGKNQFYVSAMTQDNTYHNFVWYSDSSDNMVRESVTGSDNVVKLTITQAYIWDITTAAHTYQGLLSGSTDKQYIDDQDIATLNSAKLYADKVASDGDAVTLKSANDYTDAHTPDEPAYVKEGDISFQQRVTGAGNFETWAGTTKVSSEVIATESTVDAKIAVALSTTLTFTYDDGTSEDIKVGK